MIAGRRVKYEPILSREPQTPDGHGEFPYARFPPDARGDFVEPNNMGYSDYSGSTVERSNVRVFMRDFAEHQGEEWWRLYGSHGTEAVVVRRDADERVPEMGEFFAALESYPLADESDHSEFESELDNEAWESYGLRDFQRWLESDDLDIPKLFPRSVQSVIAELPPDTATQLFEMLLGVRLDDLEDNDVDERLSTIWWEGVSRGTGEEIRHEDAVNVHFDYQRGVESYLRHAVKQSTLRVGLDFLLDHGGEWSPAAEQLFREAVKA